MQILVWIFRALVFFALFAFALNNQHEAYIRWFFGYGWHAPMIFVVLAAFGVGCVFGVLAMLPSWWRHRRRASRTEPRTMNTVPPAVDAGAVTTVLPEHPRAMDFDLQWLLLALPVAFAFGWLASRFDFRQWRREQREAPRAYFKGLGLLLNEQQDKAIDVFIEAVQQDPDTTDLHFALGNLFRRRGEYERAVRVHEHLLGRGDLSRDERERARHALAQDFLKAGLLDRAEEAYGALEGTVYETEARLALLSLYERAHDWRAAIDVAQKLERSGTGSFATRMAHHWCELALEADTQQRPTDADAALAQARQIAPQMARPWILAGQRAARQGRPQEALAAWNEVLRLQPDAVGLVAADLAQLARQTGDTAATRERLQALYDRTPTSDLLAALVALDDDATARQARLLRHLQQEPQLSAAHALLRQAAEAGAPVDPNTLAAAVPAITRAVKPLQLPLRGLRLEAQHHFWQCPGCLGWDTYPTLRLEDQ